MCLERIAHLDLRRRAVAGERSVEARSVAQRDVEVVNPNERSRDLFARRQRDRHQDRAPGWSRNCGVSTSAAATAGLRPRRLQPPLLQNHRLVTTPDTLEISRGGMARAARAR